MAINKVVYGNSTLIDLTEDTVSADKLLAGETAHNRSGESIVGSVVTAEVVDNLTTQDATKALSAKQGYVLNQNKVDKVTGKGLSTNDYTNEEKTKLAGISAGAEPNVQSDWKQSDSSSDDFIKNKPTSEVQTSNDGQFSTVTGGLMQKCLIDLEPIQDLHGYSKPWTGGSGKNKCNPDTFVQGLLNSSTGVVDSNGSWITSDYISISDTITLSGYKDGTESNFCVRLCEYDANKTFIKNTQNPNVTGNTTWSRTITLDSNTRYVRTSVGFDNKATTVSAYFATNRLQIELGSQATGFEPYSNICPISGHTQVQVGNCGKNLFNGKWSNGYYDADGNVISNNTRLASGLIAISTSDATRLTISLPTGYYAYRFCFFNSKKQFISTYDDGYANPIKIITVPNGASYIGISARNNAGTAITINDIEWSQLELGSQATEYEPYNGYTHVIDLGGTYYGGTLDAVSGVLTVTHGIVDLGTLTWTLDTGSRFLAINQMPNVKITTSPSEVRNAICSQYIWRAGSYLFNNPDAGFSYYIEANQNRLFIKDLRYSDATAFKTAMSGVQLCYELATPQTIQLDPQTLETLVGQNDVFAPLVGQTVEEVEFREVMAFEDVPKAIPYENVAPDVGTDETHTYFRIHRYGRVVVFTFLQDSMIEIVEQATRKIFGVLPERFYTKVSGAMPYDTIKYTFINQNRFGVFVPKLLEIDPTNGNVYADYEADEGICPMGSLTYILDHD